MAEQLVTHFGFDESGQFRGADGFVGRPTHPSHALNGWSDSENAVLTASGDAIRAVPGFRRTLRTRLWDGTARHRFDIWIMNPLEVFEIEEGTAVAIVDGYTGWVVGLGYTTAGLTWDDDPKQVGYTQRMSTFDEFWIVSTDRGVFFGSAFSDPMVYDGRGLRPMGMRSPKRPIAIDPVPEGITVTTVENMNSGWGKVAGWDNNSYVTITHPTNSEVDGSAYLKVAITPGLTAGPIAWKAATGTVKNNTGLTFWAKADQNFTSTDGVTSTNPTFNNAYSKYIYFLSANDGSTFTSYVRFALKEGATPQIQGEWVKYMYVPESAVSLGAGETLQSFSYNYNSIVISSGAGVSSTGVGSAYTYDQYIELMESYDYVSTTDTEGLNPDEVDNFNFVYTHYSPETGNESAGSPIGPYKTIPKNGSVRLDLYNASVPGIAAGTLNYPPGLSDLSAFTEWTESGSGTDEYYVTLLGGVGNPNIYQSPLGVLEGGEYMVKGTVGSLAQGEWGYGDNDSIGFDTIYVRLSSGVDPDLTPPKYVMAMEYGGATHVRIYMNKEEWGEGVYKAVYPGVGFLAPNFYTSSLISFNTTLDESAILVGPDLPIENGQIPACAYATLDGDTLVLGGRKSMSVGRLEIDSDGLVTSRYASGSGNWYDEPEFGYWMEGRTITLEGEDKKFLIKQVYHNVELTRVGLPDSLRVVQLNGTEEISGYDGPSGVANPKEWSLVGDDNFVFWSQRTANFGSNLEFMDRDNSLKLQMAGDTISAVNQLNGQVIVCGRNTSYLLNRNFIAVDDLAQTGNRYESAQLQSGWPGCLSAKTYVTLPDGSSIMLGGSGKVYIGNLGGWIEHPISGRLIEQFTTNGEIDSELLARAFATYSIKHGWYVLHMVGAAS